MKYVRKPISAVQWRGEHGPDFYSEVEFEYQYEKAEG